MLRRKNAHIKENVILLGIMALYIDINEKGSVLERTMSDGHSVCLI